MSKTKSFYVISALLQDSTTLGNLKRWPTEKEAIEYAKEIIALRARDGKPTVGFHVLKVVSIVGVSTPPIKVTKLK